VLAGAVYMRFDPCDLCFQQLDPNMKLFDGDWIKVLPPERYEGIVWLAREQIVDVHDPTVDSSLRRVNKRAT